MLQHASQIVVVSLLMLTQSAWAQAPATVYLDQMSHSFRELDYRGVFTYEFGNKMESLRIVHVVRDGIEKERLTRLDGDPVEYFRDGHDLSCVHPGHEKLRLDGSVMAGPFARSLLATEGVENYYELILGVVTRVADRAAQEIVVRPVDPYRYGFRLYLDEQTGLLLKSLTLGARGEILERFQFAEIEIGVLIDDDEVMPRSVDVGHQVHHHQLQETSVAAQVERTRVPEPQWLPPGFIPSARSGLRAGADAVPALMFTDGFSTFTLILEEIDALPMPQIDGRARKGATVAYTRHLTAEDRFYVVTVVGEVPLMTARKVARSVRVAGL